MGELSVFIDESGDFGEVKERPAYYLVTFVLHDQEKSIKEQVIKLQESIRNSDFGKFFYKPKELKKTFLKSIEKKYIK